MKNSEVARNWACITADEVNRTESASTRDTGERMPAANLQSEDALRRELVRYGKWLYRLGYMPATAGNLSVRLDAERLLVTPTGMSKYLMRRSDIAIVDLEGRLLDGPRRATSELGMHLAFYRERDDVQAVIHAHPPVATAFACAGWALEEMICQEAAMILGPVPLARYATTGTDDVAASLRPFIPEYDTILLASLGAVSCGTGLFSAFQKMETLEHVAQVRLAAQQLGGYNILEQEQEEQLSRARERYLQNAV